MQNLNVKETKLTFGLRLGIEIECEQKWQDNGMRLGLQNGSKNTVTV